jgi:hypothetical protein
MMKKAIKQISFLIFALSLNLVWASSSFDEVAFFQNHLSICSECSDSSDTFECFHTFCCEDDVFMTDSKIKSNLFDAMNDEVPGLTGISQNDYSNNIWQPPKFV